MIDNSCVKVQVFSIAGDDICTLELSRNVTLEGLKDEVSRAVPCPVTRSDYFCCGAETWWNPLSKPLQSVTHLPVEITWVKRDLNVGDQCFYTGPSLESNLKRGELCHLVPHNGSHLKYHRVFFPRANTTREIHEQHLSRFMPDSRSLPLECQVGDTFFYTGPPRKGRNGIVLETGASGEVIEAGLIEGSVRLRFPNFPDLCSVEFPNLSRNPPKQKCWARFKDLLRCILRLCRTLNWRRGAETRLAT